MSFALPGREVTEPYGQTVSFDYSAVPEAVQLVKIKDQGEMILHWDGRIQLDTLNTIFKFEGIEITRARYRIVRPDSDEPIPLETLIGIEKRLSKNSAILAEFESRVHLGGQSHTVNFVVTGLLDNQEPQVASGKEPPMTVDMPARAWRLPPIQTSVLKLMHDTIIGIKPSKDEFDELGFEILRELLVAPHRRSDKECTLH